MFGPFNPSPEHQAILDSVPDNDMDFDNVDYNDPATLAALTGMAAPPTMEPSVLQQQAREMSRDIFKDYAMLHSILQRHELTIHKRWLKKTRPQKLNILLTAWPNMAAVHRPDFDAFKKESRSSGRSGGRAKYRHHFVWPHINKEDLTKPKTLLLLLNSRGRHPPSAFAAADLDAMHLGIVVGDLQPVFLNNYVFILNGATEADQYGKLLAWDDHDDAFDWMTSRKQFLPGEGLLVLEAQQRLLHFLVHCCRLILHDMSDQDITSDKFPILPEPQLKTEAEVEGFESLAVMAAEAPYRVPQRLDLARVRSLLQARASAAEDHLWALREDPNYFAECLMECKEHRQEMLIDTNKDVHPANTKLRRGTLWARIIGSTIVESYLRLEIFTELSRQAQELQSLQSKYEGKISPLKNLPDDYLRALLKFRYYLDQAAKGPQNSLKHIFVASPPMRPYFVRQPPPDSTTSKIVVTSRPGVKLPDVGKQIIWLLSTLWEDGQQLFLARLTIVVDELERLLQSEPEAKNLISAHVASTIGDLSIIAQCLRQLELYQPWANGFEFQFVDYADAIKEDFANQNTKWVALVFGFQDKDLVKSQIVELGEPTGGKFDYPIGKRRTQQQVETMRQAEANLDAFWASVDERMQAKKANIQGTAVKKLFAADRALQRTAEWVPPPKPEPGAANKTVPLQDDVDQILTRPFSALYFGSQATHRPFMASHAAKNKVKTRGIPNSKQDDQGSDSEAGQNSMDPQPQFAVDARAFKVFRTLFHNPRVTSTPGEVSWIDFLHAMMSTGFVAEKLYGSVWQFQPTKLDVEKSIQ